MPCRSCRQPVEIDRRGVRLEHGLVCTRPTTPRGPDAVTSSAYSRPLVGSTPSETIVRSPVRGSLREMNPTPESRSEFTRLYSTGVQLCPTSRRELAGAAPLNARRQALQRRTDAIVEAVELPLQVGAEQEHLELVALIGNAPAEFATQRRPGRSSLPRRDHGTHGCHDRQRPGRQQQLATDFLPRPGLRRDRADDAAAERRDVGGQRRRSRRPCRPGSCSGTGSGKRYSRRRYDAACSA